MIIKSLKMMLLASVALSSQAIARDNQPQDATQNEKAEASQKTEDNVIVVTAQKRAQSLNDVGISISAFSGDELQATNLVDSNDLGRIVPGLNIGLPAGEGNQPAIYLRGIGLNDFASLNLGPVGVYVDDLFVSSASAQAVPLFDMERVEILKGPQGTLYGRNTTGGALKFISARPTDYVEGGVNLKHGNYETTKLEGYLSGPLTDWARVRAAFITNDSEGYITNLSTGEPDNGTDNYAFRFLLDLDIGENVTAELSYQGGEVDQPGARYRSQGLFEPADGVTPCSTSDVIANNCVNFFGFRNPDAFYEVDQDLTTRLDVSTDFFQSKVNWELGDVTVTSITGYQELKKFYSEDADASPLNYLHTTYATRSDGWSQELQLSGESGDLIWIVGGFYSDDNILTDNTADLGAEFRPLIESIDPVSYPNGLDPDGVAIGVPALFLRSVSALDTRVLAVFAQGEYQLTEQFRVTGGIRYTDEKRDFVQSGTFEEPAPVGDIPLYVFRDSRKDTNLSWKVGLDFEPNPDTLIYANVSTGFKGGGYNGGFLFDASEQTDFGPETLTAYELGLKMGLGNGLAQLNAAVFYNDYSDLQIFTLASAGMGVPPVNLLENASDGKIKGGEIELKIYPADGFDISLSMAYLDTELTNYQTAGGADLSGNRLVQAPEFSFNGMISYETALTRSVLAKFQLDTAYQSRVFFTSDNQQALSQPGYWLVNGRIALAGEDTKWTVGLYGKNLFDKKYLAHGFDLSGFQGSNQLMLGTPRQYGVELGFKF